MRDRLIELILNTPQKQAVIQGRANGKTYRTAENIADHLIANGIICPPCKVRDTVYVVFPKHNLIDACEVIGFIFGKNNDTLQFADGSIYTIWDKDYNEHFGKTVFLSREDAEKALKEIKNNGGS